MEKLLDSYTICSGNGLTKLILNLREKHLFVERINYNTFSIYSDYADAGTDTEYYQIDWQPDKTIVFESFEKDQAVFIAIPMSMLLGMKTDRREKCTERFDFAKSKRQNNPMSKCLGCGACCATGIEVSNILLPLGSDEKFTKAEYIEDIFCYGLRYVEGVNGIQCPYLEGVIGKGAKCSIYEGRPKACRNYMEGSSDCLKAIEKMNSKKMAKGK